MTEPPATEVSEDPPPKKFGAFGGVFTPSLLTIPSGTFSAIGFSALMYAGIALMLAGSVPRETLLGDGFVMKDRAYLPVLIYAGVFFATLSSALGFGGPTRCCSDGAGTLKNPTSSGKPLPQSKRCGAISSLWRQNRTVTQVSFPKAPSISGGIPQKMPS